MPKQKSSIAKFNGLWLPVLALKTKIFSYIALPDIFHGASKKKI